ncbi:integral membrane protein [Aaosphaeria arxii CBS 175.79]|uniref:Integral membrane protein n=1 Tax=Aaosphaeria arxii CBS 175.79 TaxID=1450172 RepID=A0A6A5XX48_9PLEO|nr:uncharacterized protein BU24DRAFT_162010 [Aaosphaeria arxii CBS 175.79]KAF2017908.1 integral membrane protein [Aaosphaeria arxii CBS 175.79]
MATHASTSHYTPVYVAEDHGQTLIVISAIFIVLDTVFVALRFYGQRISRSPAGLDDFIVPFAWFTHIGLCILGIIMVYDAGVGRHLEYIQATNPHKIAAWAKSLYALEWLYLPAVALPKISILLLYLRLFTNRSLRIACHVLIWVLVANWVAYLVASSFQCVPFEYQWNKKIPGKCFNQPAFYKTVSAPNILTDVLMLLLPLKTVFDLKVSRPRKLGVLFIFLSGGMGIVASCVRMAAFFQVDAFSDNTCRCFPIVWFSILTGFVGSSVKLVGWSIVEPGMYLIAACSVRFRPVMIKLAEKLHVKSTIIHVSQKLSRGSSHSSDVRLERVPSSYAGSSRVEKGGYEDTVSIPSKSSMGDERLPV